MYGRRNRTPSRRASSIRFYASNSRVSHYEEILRIGLQRGYRFCPLERSIDLFAEGHEKIIVLRHDVDQPSPGARAMFEVEQRLGVSSTFYFRWKTVEDDLIRDISAAGSEVGFHYEAVSDLAAEQGWKSREDLHRAGGMSLAQKRLLEDLQRFRATYDVPCRTVAGHGHALNRTCQTLNNEILWPGGLDRGKADLRAESYDPSYLKQLDAYVSDTVLEVNNGFRYGRTLLDAIASGSSRILFLTHPNHWAFAPVVRLRRIAKVLLKGTIQTNDSFSYQDWLRDGRRAGQDFSRDDFWPREVSAQNIERGKS